MALETPHGFDAAYSLADRIPGWLTRDQALVLWREAAALPEDGLVVEIGSHQGRSTVLLARASTSGLTAIDPFVPDWRYGAVDTRRRLEDHLAEAGVGDRVRVLARRSTDLRPDWTEPLALLYVDGKHDFWTAGDDLRWAEHVPEHGRVLVHDAFSSLGVTAAVLRHVLPSRRLRYVDRTGSLARFEVGLPTVRDRFRILAELPWFGRNLVVKVLLRLRLGAVARRLGHHDSADPY